jgi:hypothetical protein
MAAAARSQPGKTIVMGPRPLHIYTARSIRAELAAAQHLLIAGRRAITAIRLDCRIGDSDALGLGLREI